MDALVVVGLYLVVTAPMLVLLLRVHNLNSDYTRLFMAALLLQIIPLGLLFFPVGFLGVGLLAVTLVATRQRNARFRALGIHNPEVARRWRQEYLLNLWAIGLAIEQKGVAYLFMQVSTHRGLDFLWTGLLPMTVVIWAGLGWAIVRETRSLRSLSAS